jgi:hypothetical protein
MYPLPGNGQTGTYFLRYFGPMGRMPHFSLLIGKVKLSLYRPWRPLGLREVEAPTFSDIRLIYGGKPYAPATFYLQEDGTHFC